QALTQPRGQLRPALPQDRWDQREPAAGQVGEDERFGPDPQPGILRRAGQQVGGAKLEQAAGALGDAYRAACRAAPPADRGVRAGRSMPSAKPAATPGSSDTPWRD